MQTMICLKWDIERRDSPQEMSADLGELSEELQSLHALRRSSSGSRCIHEHHCGSQASVNTFKSIKGAYGMGEGSMELPPFRGGHSENFTSLGDFHSSLRKKSWPSVKQGRMHHGLVDRGLGQEDRVMEEDEEEEEDGRYGVYVRRAGSRRGNFEMVQQRSLSMDFWIWTNLSYFGPNVATCEFPFS